MTRTPFLLCGAASLVLLSGPALAQIGTTQTDFRLPGTQAGDLIDPIASSGVCLSCHSGWDETEEPYTRWSGGMMANSMRDPVFQAAMTIANQDAAEAGTFCMRCHTPGGSVEGNAVPADGSALGQTDYEGVTCNVCHRMVDPIPAPENPSEDGGILASLLSPPSTAQGGQYVLDDFDRRRGPFDLGPSFFFHDWLESPFHTESLLCANCHQVSNPLFSRSGGPTPSASDTYDLNALNAEAPDHDATELFPIERTYSEWALSDFAAGPIDMGGRFGGNDPLVSSCQDCHMPTTEGTGCHPAFDSPVRTDLPQHNFYGANSWVPLAIYSLDQSLLLYGALYTNGQPLDVFEATVARNKEFLRLASDLELSKVGSDLKVRIVNQTGHKLPTGYGEGRRMWINVKFYAGKTLLLEHGHYDHATADLTTVDTKVYEIHQGLDANMASATGLPEAPSFHFALNNKIYKDNRIPPRGFVNAAFEAAQCQPVGHAYADGQYWDDTLFAIPAGATHAAVTVYHQTTAKEYIEFLRDENTTDSKGQIAYDEWVAAGKSRPVQMDRKTISFVGKVLPAGDPTEVVEKQL